MKRRMHTLAVALAAAGITVALAQAPATQPLVPPLPDNLVVEPTASLSRTDGPGADMGKQLVDAINADQALKGSKVTVQPDEGKITLTGVTQTRAQARQIGQMAAQQVGVENVENAIRDSEATVEVTPPQPAQAAGDQQAEAQADPQAPAQEPQAAR